MKMNWLFHMNVNGMRSSATVFIYSTSNSSSSGGQPAESETNRGLRGSIQSRIPAFSNDLPPHNSLHFGLVYNSFLRFMLCSIGDVDG